MKRDPGALRAPRGPLCRGESRLPFPSRGTYASLDGQIATRNDGAKAFRGFPQGLTSRQTYTRVSKLRIFEGEHINDNEDKQNYYH